MTLAERHEGFYRIKVAEAVSESQDVAEQARRVTEIVRGHAFSPETRINDRDFLESMEAAMVAWVEARAEREG